MSRSLLLRPDVEEFTLPLFEALAECVRKIISERTKVALAGTGPRQPRLSDEAYAIADAAHKVEAEAHTAAVGPRQVR